VSGDRQDDDGPAPGRDEGAALPPGPRDQIGFADLPPAPPRPVLAAGDGPVSPLPPPLPEVVADEEHEHAHMGLLDHLEELRKVIFQSLTAMGIAATLCWFKSGVILDLLIRPLGPQGAYFMSPSGAFMARLKVACGIGLFVVAPFVLFRVYGFVLPGLYRKERRVATPVLVWTVLLFYAGVVLAYWGYPFILQVMMNMGTATMKPMIEVGSYLSSLLQFVLCCGLIFELPMVILALCVAGIVRPQWLLAQWRYVLVVTAVVAAAITPDGNVINQAILMVPILVLFLGSVLVSLVVVRNRNRRDAGGSVAEGD
jgi:sec-independent protein translocase protein TatC